MSTSSSGYSNNRSCELFFMLWICLISQGIFQDFVAILLLEYPGLSACSGVLFIWLFFGYAKQCLSGLQILLNNLQPYKV